MSAGTAVMEQESRLPDFVYIENMGDDTFDNDISTLEGRKEGTRITLKRGEKIKLRRREAIRVRAFVPPGGMKTHVNLKIIPIPNTSSAMAPEATMQASAVRIYVCPVCENEHDSKASMIQCRDSHKRRFVGRPARRRHDTSAGTNNRPISDSGTGEQLD